MMFEGIMYPDTHNMQCQMDVLSSGFKHQRAKFTAGAKLRLWRLHVGIFLLLSNPI